MRTTQEIRHLLEKLDKHPADALEDQDLDFKEWNTRSMKDAVALAIEMAVCLAHGSGGTVVFGVSDKNIGSDKATQGVPPEVDVNRLREAIYNSTDPKQTPVFEEMEVMHGTRRILVMQIYPGITPYTDTSER